MLELKLAASALFTLNELFLLKEGVEIFTLAEKLDDLPLVSGVCVQFNAQSREEAGVFSATKFGLTRLFNIKFKLPLKLYLSLYWFDNVGQ